MKRFCLIIILLISMLIGLDSINAYRCYYTGDAVMYSVGSNITVGEAHVIEIFVFREEDGYSENSIDSFYSYSDDDEFFPIYLADGIFSHDYNYREYSGSEIIASLDGTCQQSIRLVKFTSLLGTNFYYFVLFNDGILDTELSFGSPYYCNPWNYCLTYTYEDNYIFNLDSERTNEINSSEVTSSDIIYECRTYSDLYTDMQNYYSAYKSCEGDATCYSFLDDYNLSKQSLINYCSVVTSDQDYSDSCLKSCLNINDDVQLIEGRTTSSVASCGLSTKLVVYLKKILKWVRYIVPVIVIILGIVDYISAIASASDDQMKKAQKRFVIRLVAAALIFIIPFIIEFLLNVFKIGGDSTYCGLN